MTPSIPAKVGYFFFLIYVISYFLRLPSRYPVLGSIRLDLILAAVTLGFVIITLINNGGLSTGKRENSVLIANRLRNFVLFIFLSLPLVTWPGSVLRGNLLEWFKVFVFFLFVFILVQNRSQLKWLVVIFIGCQIIRFLEPLHLHMTTGYWGSAAYSTVGGSLSKLSRLSGSPYDVVNPNQLAWVIVTVVPFVFYLCWKGGWFGKLFSIALMPPAVYCLLLTGSRSGFVCLVFVMFVMVALSGKITTNFLRVGVFVLPIAIFFLGALDSALQTRYLSLIDSDAVGADTAQGRIDGIVRKFETISKNPLFGNGLGTSGEANRNILGGSGQITHNLYLEIVQETGLLGFALFMLFIVAIIRGLAEAKDLALSHKETEDDWLLRLVTAIQAWVFMQLFYSMSCFGLSSWEWYFFGGMASTCLVLAREKRLRIESVAPDPLENSSRPLLNEGGRKF